MKRRLLVLAPAQPPAGGVAIQTGMLLESEVMRSTFDIRMIRTNPPKDTEDPSSRKKGGILWAWRLMAGAIRTASTWRPEAVLAVLNGDSSFLRNAPAALLAGRMARCPVLMHMHASRSGFWHFRRAHRAGPGAEEPPPPANLFTRAGDGLCASLAGRATAVSHLTTGIDEAYVAKGWPPARAVIPNMSPVQVADAKDRDGRGLIFIGRLSREKGFIDLLDALGMEPLSRVGWRLEVLGAAPSREAADAVEGALSGHARRGDIVLHGVLGGEAKRRVMARSTVLVLPSYIEVFPAVILEAMSAGMAVVATPAGEIPGILDPGGWIRVPPGRPEIMAAEIAGLLGDPDRASSMGRHNRDLAERYSVENVSSGMCGLIVSLIEEGRRA